MTIGLFKILKSHCIFLLVVKYRVLVPQTICRDSWFLPNNTRQLCLLCAAAPQVSTLSNTLQQYLTLKPHSKSHRCCFVFFSSQILLLLLIFNVVLLGHVSKHNLGNNTIFVPLQLNQDKICSVLIYAFNCWQFGSLVVCLFEETVND